MWIYTHPYPPIIIFFLCMVVFTWLDAHFKGVLSREVIKRHVFDKCCMYAFLLNAHLNTKGTCIEALRLNKWLFLGRIVSKRKGISRWNIFCGLSVLLGNTGQVRPDNTEKYLSFRSTVLVIVTFIHQEELTRLFEITRPWHSTTWFSVERNHKLNGLIRLPSEKELQAIRTENYFTS